jgi:hypothetical protein
MNRTGDTEPSPTLVPLGDADVAVCTDGVCEVPAPTETGTTQP